MWGPIVEEAADALKKFLDSVLSANMVVQILMSGSMSYLWGLINSLQMAVYIILFNITTPDNVFTVFKVLIAASSFDFIKTQD